MGRSTSKTRRLIQALCVLAAWGSFTAYGAPATEPLTQAKEALGQGKFEEAQRWFQLTSRDFPKAPEGEEAILQQIFLRIASELSSIRLSTLYRDAAALNRTEGELSARLSGQSNAYETRAVDAVLELKKLTPIALSFKSLAIPLQFSVATEGWEIDPLRVRVKKGELLEATDRAALERGEFISSYLGFVATVLNLPDDKVLENPHQGTVQGPVLLNAIGGRFYIASQARKDEQKMKLARSCFKRTLELTKSTPYDKHRQEALNFIAKLDRAEGGVAAAEKPAKLCPVDQAPMKAEWKFCPFHGVKLGKKK